MSIIAFNGRSDIPSDVITNLAEEFKNKSVAVILGELHNFESGLKEKYKGDLDWEGSTCGYVDYLKKAISTMNYILNKRRVEGLATNIEEYNPSKEAYPQNGFVYRGVDVRTGLQWITGKLFILDSIKAKEEPYFIQELKPNWLQRFRKVNVLKSTIRRYSGYNDKYGEGVFEGDILADSNGFIVIVGPQQENANGLYFFYTIDQGRIKYRVNSCLNTYEVLNTVLSRKEYKKCRHFLELSLCTQEKVKNRRKVYTGKYHEITSF